MILSDRDILARLADGSLVIDPLSNPEEQIQPASVDLCLGDAQQTHRWETSSGVLRETGARWMTDDAVVIHPGAFTLGCTIERVRIPADLVGVVDGRSSYGRLGLAVHITAGYIDPGFEGQITLELYNHSQEPITLRRGDRIAQLRLHTMTSPAERPYGHPSRGSKYQGQLGTTPSRIKDDGR